MPGRPRSSASPQESANTSVRVSPTDADPLAALRIYRIAVDLGERRFIIPALPARDWLEVLLAEDLNPEDLFPGLCGTDDVIAVNQMLIDGTVTMEQMSEAIYSVLEEATGRRWWVALRLCRTIRAGWDRVGGRLASHGVTPFEVPLAYWLDGAYAAILDIIMEADPKAVGSFTQKLTAPPPGLAKQAFESQRSKAVEAFRSNMNRAKTGR
jgi:hypothetical protein